jgi:hypothetical protein
MDVHKVSDVKLVMIRLALLAAAAIAALLMFAPSAPTSGASCPFVTAPAAQCQTDDGQSGFGNGQSPFEYPMGFPGAL